MFDAEYTQYCYTTRDVVAATLYVQAGHALRRARERVPYNTSVQSHVIIRGVMRSVITTTNDTASNKKYMMASSRRRNNTIRVAR